jgi:hypothetical protein
LYTSREQTRILIDAPIDQGWFFESSKDGHTLLTLDGSQFIGKVAFSAPQSVDHMTADMLLQAACDSADRIIDDYSGGPSNESSRRFWELYKRWDDPGRRQHRR